MIDFVFGHDSIMEREEQKGMIGLITLLFGVLLIVVYVFWNKEFSYTKTVERATSTLESTVHAVDAAQNVKNMLEVQSEEARNITQ